MDRATNKVLYIWLSWIYGNAWTLLAAAILCPVVFAWALIAGAFHTLQWLWQQRKSWTGN